MAELLSIVATSLRNYGTELHDQVFGAHPGYWWLREHGAVDPYDGGTGITEDIQVAKNSTVGWRDPKSKIPIKEQDPLRQVLWVPASITGSLPIYRADQRKNAQRIREFTKSLITNLEDTMTDAVGAAFFEDGTTDDGEATLQGLESMISATNSYGTLVLESSYESMNRGLAKYAFWQSTVLSTAEAFSLNGGTDGGLRKLVDSCKKGKNQQQPDLIVTTLDLWEAFEALLLPSQKYENPKLAEAGFRNLMFDNAAVVWDENCPSSYTYSLNSKHIKIRPDKPCAAKIVMTDPHPSEDSLADIILAVWDGQMTCANPRFLGKMTNKTKS